MFGALLGGIGKLLGGKALAGGIGKSIIGSLATTAIQGYAAKKQAEAERAQSLEDTSLQYMRLRDAAELGGFNPLSVLRAGGSGIPNPTPALSSKAFVADALGAGVKTFFNGDQMRRDIERDALEKALMREELRAMQSQGRAVTSSSMQFGFGIPQANNYTGVDTQPPMVELTTPKRTKGYVFDGKWMFSDPEWGDTENMETRIGELGAEAYGARVAAADLAYQENARLGPNWRRMGVSTTTLPRLPGVPVADDGYWWMK